jgi:hypothetical protein
MKLTPYEARIVLALYNAFPRTLSKFGLQDAMVGSQCDDVKIVDVYVCKIRAKLGRTSIATTWGAGYAMSSECCEIVAQVLDTPRFVVDVEALKTQLRPAIEAQVRAEFRERVLKAVA